MAECPSLPPFDVPSAWSLPPGWVQSPTAVGAPEHAAGVGDPRLPAPAAARPPHVAVRGSAAFDTDHATELYPELDALVGWSWSWVGGGTTAQLISYHHGGAAAVELLYIDSDTHATLTRTDTAGRLQLHQSGELAAVVAMLGTRGAS